MKYIISVVLVLLLVSCQHVEKPERPDDLISEELMADIFTDVYLSNAAKSVNNKVIRQKGIRLDSFIYKKHRIDSLQFVRSNAYYSADLDAYERIFSEVEERLVALKVEADSLNFKPATSYKNREDSLKKAKKLVDPPKSD